MKLEQYMMNGADGKPSTARTAFFYGCGICLSKLLLSGLAIGPLNLGSFSGGDFALAIGALGGIYALDKTVRGDKPSA